MKTELNERPKDVSSNREQGQFAQEIFAGKIDKPAIKELYSESAQLFAELIKNRLMPRDEPYELLDVGSFKGDLVDNVVSELGDSYKIKATGIDINGDALIQNTAVDRKVVGDISAMPFRDRQFDISEARYVMPWNVFEKQGDILKEISRVTKGFAIIQHAGADDVDTASWQGVMHNLLNGAVEKLKRKVCYFASAQELEGFMDKMGIKYERVQSRRVDHVSQVFIEKFNLNEVEAQKVISRLGAKDYIYQTTWVITKL
jgi:ubiquinone/menaquinone biosynthesis C-methylase UbiE